MHLLDDFGGITVSIAAHMPRVHSGQLQRALASVASQTLQPVRVSLAIDTRRDGAAVTKQRALDGVTTPWVAFLDSDDWWDPDHLETLAAGIREFDADYAFSYFHGPDVLGTFGKAFDREHPHETTTTVLMRTELAQKVGFRQLPERSQNSGDDWAMLMGCVHEGAKIVHIPKRTWTYSMSDGDNTSGLGRNW